jgi:hypothetical protein
MARFPLVNKVITGFFPIAGRVLGNVTDKLFAPEHSQTIVNSDGTTEQVQVKGFFRSRTNISGFSAALFFVLSVFKIDFGLPEADFINILYYTGEAISIIGVSYFRKKARTRI